MENPFKKAVKDEEKTKEIEDGVKAQMDSEEATTQTNSEENSTETEETIEEINEINPLQEKYDTLNNQYIRLAADFENFRKRTEQEREALLKYGAENTLQKKLRNATI